MLDGVDGAGQPGFDHCLVIDRPVSAKGDDLVECALVEAGGIAMRVVTTKPGVQLYTVGCAETDCMHTCMHARTRFTSIHAQR